MESVYVGLIRGRHEMPCNDYIFDRVDNVHNYDEIYLHIHDWIMDNIGSHQEYDTPINSASCYDEILVTKGNKHLYVYVTGLTTVTARLINCCARYGINLTLLNYDRDSGQYLEQFIF